MVLTPNEERKKADWIKKSVRIGKLESRLGKSHKKIKTGILKFGPGNIRWRSCTSG